MPWHVNLLLFFILGSAFKVFLFFCVCHSSSVITATEFWFLLPFSVLLSYGFSFDFVQLILVFPPAHSFDSYLFLLHIWTSCDWWTVSYLLQQFFPPFSSFFLFAQSNFTGVFRMTQVPAVIIVGRHIIILDFQPFSISIFVLFLIISKPDMMRSFLGEVNLDLYLGYTPLCFLERCQIQV